MEIASVFSIKGGEGKTTVSLAASDVLSAQHGLKVLAIDLDPQGSLTTLLGGGQRNVWAGRSLWSISRKGETGRLVDELRSVIRPDVSNIENASGGLDLIEAAPYDLDEIDNEGYQLRDLLDSASALSGAFRKLGYEYVVVDTPPANPIAMIPVLSVSSRVVVPMVPNRLSQDCLEPTLKTIAKAQERARDQISTRIVFSKIKPTNDAFAVMREVSQYAGARAPVRDAKVSRSESCDGIMERAPLTFRNMRSKYRDFSAKYAGAKLFVRSAIEMACDLDGARQ